MKSIFIFILLLAFTSCSGQSQHSENLSKDIIGCWEDRIEELSIESNFPKFDSLALEKLKQKSFDYMQKKKTIQEFKDSHIYIYMYDKETGEKNVLGKTGYPVFTYKIDRDSLCINTIDDAGGYRKSIDISRRYIVNDTLYTELDIMDEVDRIHTYASIRETLEFPEDFKITKAVRKGKSVRVKNCKDW